MKRSVVNSAIDWAIDLLERENWRIPAYAYWTPEDWKNNREQCGTIQKVMNGWDVTDYGLGTFEVVGGVLYTIRNGLLDGTAGTPYAEKLLLFRPGQSLPTHFHYTKTEDIINRAGGNMWIELFNSNPDGEIDTESPVAVYMDGIRYVVGPGERLILIKGQSITLTPGLYHRFGATDDGELVAGEVSSINDDNIDNRFNPEMPRYVEIEEDEPARYVLCNEYNSLWKGEKP
jgi:D-lyxose ketol-isomerase